VGVAGLLGVATPTSSVMGGKKPACYIAAAFADGTVQCLLRDSLQQIESVELPRTGNLGVSGSSQGRVSVTICSLSFTATANCLVVTDSLGHIYVYKVSPISDPGGPPSNSFTLTMLEYGLISGRDCWDLVLASKFSKLEAICERFSDLFYSQPTGVQQFYFSRFMSLRSSLLRLSTSSQYRAGDTFALIMLHSIYQDFNSLLRPLDSSQGEDGASLVEKVLSVVEDTGAGTQPELEQLLAGSTLVREPVINDPLTLANLNHLSMWVVTLTLHTLAAVPEFRNVKRGPGYTLVTGDALLSPSAPVPTQILRHLLACIKLWNLSRESASLCSEKDTDLTSKLYNLVTRLARKQDDETLIDECLMLPHKVMIPPLDILTSPRGVLSCLHSVPFPLKFTQSIEPDLPNCSPIPFLEGLNYTHGSHARFFYDSVNKLYLGESPASVKKCTRCSAVTLPTSGSKSTFCKMWEKRWLRGCLCGGPWKAIQMF